MEKSDTIFAAATPVAESSISVIRISGPGTFEIVSRIFSRNKNKFVAENLAGYQTHSIHHGFVFDENQLVDEVLVFLFKSPDSFTGEDVIEISSHGGVFIYSKISKLLAACGAVHAEPGEFSKRAFLNGKLDLIQAEAVADLIRAKTELASRVALNQLSGGLSAKINDLRTELINYCSLVELELDFSDEDIELIKKDKLLEVLENIADNVKTILSTYDSGRIIKEGINLAIIGEPNVGKSSIFNYLVQKNRAIVTEVPGTTRDYIEESLIIDGLLFNLVDTAGIRQTVDSVEKEGIERSFQSIEKADIVLKVVDLSAAPGGKKINNVNIFLNGKQLTVYNKLDIAEFHPKDELCISTKTGENMDILTHSIKEKAKSIVQGTEISESYVTNQRHRACLLKTCEYLNKAKALIASKSGNELISFEVREALNALGEMMGKTTNADILNNIFSKFCIGK